jgi:hypothetical protein
MDPYAKPQERRVGENRPKIQHIAEDPERPRTRSERQAEKQSVAAERRAIKKSARRDLERQLRAEVENLE